MCPRCCAARRRCCAVQGIIPHNVLCCSRCCPTQGVVLFKVLCCYSRCCAAVQGVVPRKVLCHSRCYTACPRCCDVRRRRCAAVQGVVPLFKVLCCCSRSCAAVQGVVPLKVLIRVSKVLCCAPKALCHARCCTAIQGVVPSVQGVVSLFKVLYHARGCAVQGIVPCKVLCRERYCVLVQGAVQDAGPPKTLGCPRHWAAQGASLPGAQEFSRSTRISRSMSPGGGPGGPGGSRRLREITSFPGAHFPEKANDRFFGDQFGWRGPRLFKF